MRTIAAGWSIPHREVQESGSWLSNMGAKLLRSGRAAGRHPTTEAASVLGQSRDAFVQADVSAFISAFMRIG